MLQAVASQIEIPDDLVYYFGLYLVKKGADESMSSNALFCYLLP